MNLVLLFQKDFVAPGRVCLHGRRKDHITTVLRSKPGDLITVGHCNGQIGQGTVVSVAKEEIILDAHLNQQPPDPLPLTLILALPRPHMFKRSLSFAASLGIKKIFISNFGRVDKSLWNSSALKPETVKEHLVLGLEQAKDTILPEVVFERSFKEFVKERLPGLAKNTFNLVAHPGSSNVYPKISVRPITFVIGPEGGILDYELHLLTEVGFQTIGLGPRILRVDAVLPFIVGKLFS